MRRPTGGARVREEHRNPTAPWPRRRVTSFDEALAGRSESSAKGMTPRAHPGSNPDFSFTIVSRRA
jgi:hypothetical protein